MEDKSITIKRTPTHYEIYINDEFYCSCDFDELNEELEEIENGQERAEAGELAFGTVDTWLVHHFSKGKDFVTDVTNASKQVSHLSCLMVLIIRSKRTLRKQKS